MEAGGVHESGVLWEFPCRPSQDMEPGEQLQSWGLGVLAFLPPRLALTTTPLPALCPPAHQVMFPVFLGEPVSPETLAATLAEMDATLQIFEDNFLQNKAFLAGPHISLADLVAITELMHVSAVGRAGPLGWVGRRSPPSAAPPWDWDMAYLWSPLLELCGPQTRQVLLGFARPPLPCPVPSSPTARGRWLPDL